MHKDLFLAMYMLTDLVFFLIVWQVIKEIISYASMKITCICDNMLVDLCLLRCIHSTMSHECSILLVM